MTGTICSVATCKSNSERAKKEGELIFYFPQKKGVFKTMGASLSKKRPL